MLCLLKTSAKLYFCAKSLVPCCECANEKLGERVISVFIRNTLTPSWHSFLPVSWCEIANIKGVYCFFCWNLSDPFPHKVLKRLNILYPRCSSVFISDKLAAKPASTLTAVDINTSRFKCFQWEFFGCLVNVADMHSWSSKYRFILITPGMDPGAVVLRGRGQSGCNVFVGLQNLIYLIISSTFQKIQLKALHRLTLQFSLSFFFC